jgi:hypothetical protein
MQRHSLSEDVKKILFAENLIVEKRRESLHVSESKGLGKPVIQWIRVGSDF